MPAGQSAWEPLGSSDIPGKPGITAAAHVHGYTIYGQLQSQADMGTYGRDVNFMAHTQNEEVLFSDKGVAMHSKDLPSKLLPQSSSSPQADGIASAVYNTAAAQVPMRSLVLPALWSPEQEDMAQVGVAICSVYTP